MKAALGFIMMGLQKYLGLKLVKAQSSEESDVYHPKAEINS